ncbi:LOW QUALITY PROTEIN: hypothetical protein QYF61_018873 [Mycteria americana]|uniref:Uncharacterized protein n=1 Tax=Mycteria americana TaxID=33587 RepID=A0AAN7PUR3_MYCAM|nr:LOW QUALITY PROTEIN: hypothetical protein QYF61_018873 [Mycteria americana]
MVLLLPKCRTLHLALLNPIQLTLAHRSSLSSLPTLKQINTPTQLGVICKLTEGALNPLIQIIDKDIKQNWPQHRALGNTACDRPPTGVNSIHHHSLGPAIQPVLYPAKSTPVQAMSSQFLQENAPVPMLDNPFGEDIFPNIQSKPPLVQLEAISSHPITCYLGEETNTHLATTSFQVVVESNKVSPQPLLLQTKQPQFPHPLLIRLLLQTLHQLRCSSLDMLKHLNVSLVVRGPKLNTVFQGYDRFPSPAGHIIFDTSQDAIGLLGRLGTLPAHIQAAVNQHSQVLLCQAAFQPLFPKPVALHGVVVTQVQDLALSLVEPHTIGLGPLIHTVQNPLAFLPSRRSMLPPNLLSSANLLRAHSIPSSRSLIKILNRTGSKTEPRRTSLVTGHHLHLTPFTITLWARPSSQFFTQQRVHLSKP